MDEKIIEGPAGGPQDGAPAAAQPQGPAVEIGSSRQFNAWLAEQKVSLAFTTYQAGKLFLIGTRPDGRQSIFERTFSRCMGLHATPQTLYMTSLYQIWRLENALAPGESHQGYDRLYVPQVGWTTGDIDVHDVALDRDGRIVFVNTLFGCLATVSETHSFVPLWKPPFISKLAAEDRCHLNGLAMEDGRPKYVTSVSRSDAADGWRDYRRDGGTVTDVDSSEIVITGLSMPHSPRVYAGKLWLLDSGNGNFGYVDVASGRFEPVCPCNGYARGLAFHGDYAIIGLSQARKNKTFSGLALQEILEKRGIHARCGLQVIDLRSGDAVHWLRVQGIVDELYDVGVLPGVQRPMAIGFKSDEIRRTLTIGPSETLAG